MVKKESTSKRLKSIMEMRDLRQMDILKLAEPYCERYNVTLNKVDLSQYLSGRCEPTQAKLYVLSKALRVQDSWLMGFDVPMTLGEQQTQEQVIADLISDDDVKRKLIAYTKLPLADKVLLDSLVSTFLQSKGLI